MIDQRYVQQIALNWQVVCDQVRDAALQAGRQAEEIRIVGVTKYVDAETTAALVRAGCFDLGENRPQVLWEKADSDEMDDSIRWHLIGHLQRNKVRRTLQYRPRIHSIDSPRLLPAVSEESLRLSITTEVLLEINISGDDTKTGMNANQIESLIDQGIPQGVHLVGLMAMAGLGTDRGSAQQQFAAVRRFRDTLRQRTDLPLSELSMGMSKDFVEAIAEGATMVRIGSRLFSTTPS